MALNGQKTDPNIREKHKLSLIIGEGRRPWKEKHSLGLQNFCGKSFLTKIIPVRCRLNNLGKRKSKYIILNIC